MGLGFCKRVRILGARDTLMRGAKRWFIPPIPGTALHKARCRLHRARPWRCRSSKAYCDEILRRRSNLPQEHQPNSPARLGGRAMPATTLTVSIVCAMLAVLLQRRPANSEGQALPAKRACWRRFGCMARAGEAIMLCLVERSSPLIIPTPRNALVMWSSTAIGCTIMETIMPCHDTAAVLPLA